MDPLRAYDWNGQIVRYRELGEGFPILFLHNGGSDHRIWQYQLEKFAPNFRVVAVDLPGFGTSHRPDRPYDLDFYVDFVKDFVGARGWDSLILVGNCIGAAIALEFAKRYPSLVKSLVLFNVLGGRWMIRPTSGINLPVRPATRLYLEGLGKILSRSAFARRVVARGLFGDRGSWENDDVFRHLLELSGRPEQVRSRWNLIRGLDSYGRFGKGFPRPAVPRTLLFWGAKNRVLSEETGKEFSAWLGPERMVWVPKAGHMAMVEASELVNAEIAEFLSLCEK